MGNHLAVNNKHSSNVILFPIHQSVFQDLLIVAQMMEIDGRYHPIMILPTPDLEEYATQSNAEASGIELERLYALSEGNASLEQAGNVYGKKELWADRLELVLRYAKNRIHLLLPFHQVFCTVNWFNQARAAAKQVFDKYSPVALLLGCDRHLGIEQAFIRIARERKCLSVVVPFDILEQRYQPSGAKTVCY